ncbi:hypothetical protein I5M27_14585 [Adhaeribacter sp. BT258]|uniref:Uncharacterized protein n=1 Tax=Adhaeribacter terrigena TaxID=2793070 RepID=A0ABS1C4D5_9BACT|nr:hypothetical protein [Adhaeribacter terrigena]MBK0404220.1 hypothetical protein [Adhaeribacter terrigena]
MKYLPYCRMEETYEAMKDVVENWDNTSMDREFIFRLRIVELCKQIVAKFKDEEEAAQPTTEILTAVQIIDSLDEIGDKIPDAARVEILASLFKFTGTTVSDYDELENILKKYSR